MRHDIWLGALILSGLHALIPSHWLPFITIGKAEHWTLRRTLGVTLLAGLAHTLSTSLLGLVISLAGVKLEESYHELSERMIPLFLMGLGGYYLYQHRRHAHAHTHLHVPQTTGASFSALVVSLSLGMFLSPCLEIEAYFLSAGVAGWSSVVGLLLIYNVVTLLGMLTLVYVGSQGLARVRLHWLDHREHLVTGLTLIGLALLNFFIEF